MVQIESLNIVIQYIANRRLGKAIDELENYLLSHSNMSDMEVLADIKSNYQLMAAYWQRGFDDPERETVYNKLLRRLYMLTVNVMIHDRIRSSSFLHNIYNRPRQIHQGWSMSEVKRELEDFVSNAALLELKPEHVRQPQVEALYKSHQELMHDLFDYILTSRLWKDSLADAFEDILLSPTIDIVDQQLIVSAITLSVMNAFGPNKFNVLVHVYQRATDESLRQRALVGWVLSMNSGPSNIYTEMIDIVRSICEDEKCCNEITELQYQLIYCMEAEKDTQTIQNEIIPDIMNGNNVKMTSKGLVEMDEDSLDDILHPEDAERNMERMEKSMQMMIDMQKKGSDIYFGGFSQMKRFPFFNDISNWFVPFYPQHPGISQVWNNTKGKRFLQTITKLGAFCDSDKYSFVLAFNMVLDRLPASMLDLVEKGEADPVPLGGNIPTEEQTQPAFIRRMYLQNFYRFFKLFYGRNEFVNIFSSDAKTSDYVFFASELLKGTKAESRFLEVAAFLVKHHRYEEAKELLDHCSDSSRGYQYYMLMGNVSQHLYGSSYMYYSEAVKQNPESERVLSAFARSAFMEEYYVDAMMAYESLLKIQPEKKNYLLNYAVCLIRVHRNDDAMKLLYKLYYLYPDDDNVCRVLAWGLVLDRKWEQAEKLYTKLLSIEKPLSSDMLNYGYCLWFSGCAMEAIGMFSELKSEELDFSMEFLEHEHELILSMGIGEAEVNLMLDAIG